MAKANEGTTIELHDGRVLTLDPYALTWDDVMSVRGLNGNDEAYKALMGKLFGLNADEVGKLPYPDARKLDKTFAEFIANPVGADPS